ncbi:hypothetical protein [Marininema halotolerans]|uniref:Uncharacterized protein n=1 Tax=Marininema halotolerans TaxID=1155944 RepID=A0A1I6TU86_9BACL|nr:hypothetical protein [Marininema halotolerans]SFS92803.1 hypothetical protein SAMN05444972_11180 [Marininema halotolerans]
MSKKKKWTIGIIVGVGILGVLTALSIGLLNMVYQEFKDFDPVAMEQEMDVDMEDYADEEESYDYEGMTGYKINKSKEEDDVKLTLTNLFLRKDKAVVEVKVKNNTDNEIRPWIEERGMLSLDGKQLMPNYEDSFYTNTVLKGSEATLYISFKLPKNIHWSKVKQVQFGSGSIDDEEDYEYVSNLSMKVENVASKKDKKVSLDVESIDYP